MIRFLVFLSCSTLVLHFSCMSDAKAGEYDAQVKAFVESKIAKIATSPEVIAAVNAANIKHVDLSQADIDELDKKWRADDAVIIDSVMNNATSQFLKKQVEENQGVLTEIILMDDKGLNVALSDQTSDYWQGDEAKWQKTYKAGAGAIDVSDVDFDESSQMFVLQISVPVLDGTIPIGALTVGINADEL